MFEICKLKNGVTLVLEKMPYVRSIAFGIYVKNGSRNENEENNGISHFIEHMLFKGTENRKAKDIADEMDAIGGQVNAYTSKEHTCYYTRTLDTHFDIAIDVLADIFFNSLFDDEEIQKERKVIIEEINMYEDTPDDLVYDNLQYNIWKNNPLRLPVLGTVDSISSFKHDTFKNYFKNNYRTDNTVIAVAGSFDTSEIIKTIEKYFGNWNSQNDIVNNIIKPEYNISIIKKDKDIEQIHMCMAFPSIPLGSDESYTLSAMNAVLGGGMSSRLFQRIREQNGLAYSVYSYNSSYVDTGALNIYAALNPSQLNDVINLIFDELDNFKNNDIVELEKTKEQIKSNLLLSLESTASRMSNIGRPQVLLNRILTPDELITKIDNITHDKMKDLINKIFDFDKASISVVGRVENVNLEEIFNNAK